MSALFNKCVSCGNENVMLIIALGEESIFYDLLGMTMDVLF